MSKPKLRWFFLALLLTGNLNASELDGRYDDVESLTYSVAPELLGATAAQLRELAPIVSEQSQVWQDPFEPERWQATTELKFVGLSLKFVESSDGDGVSVIAFTLSDLSRLAPPVRQLMRDTFSVEELLGPPLANSDNQWMYQGQHSSLQIEFEDGQVTQISVWLHWC